MSASYRDLRVCQNAINLVVSVYQEPRGFPKKELYGLTRQMRRAVSIPSNIAEGKGDRLIGTVRYFSVTRGAHSSNWRLKF